MRRPELNLTYDDYQHFFLSLSSLEPEPGWIPSDFFHKFPVLFAESERLDGPLPGSELWKDIINQLSRIPDLHNGEDGARVAHEYIAQSLRENENMLVIYPWEHSGHRVYIAVQKTRSGDAFSYRMKCYNLGDGHSGRMRRAFLKKFEDGSIHPELQAFTDDLEDLTHQYDDGEGDIFDVLQSDHGFESPEEKEAPIEREQETDNCIVKNFLFLMRGLMHDDNKARVERLSPQELENRYLKIFSNMVRACLRGMLRTQGDREAILPASFRKWTEHVGSREYTGFTRDARGIFTEDGGFPSVYDPVKSDYEALLAQHPDLARRDAPEAAGGGEAAGDRSREIIGGSGFGASSSRFLVSSTGAPAGGGEGSGGIEEADEPTSPRLG